MGEHKIIIIQVLLYLIILIVKAIYVHYFIIDKDNFSHTHINLIYLLTVLEIIFVSLPISYMSHYPRLDLSFGPYAGLVTLIIIVVELVLAILIPYLYYKIYKL
jgi:hypothetical protein